MERDFDKKLVPIGQAAEFLGVSVDTVRRWDEKGILHSQRPDGKDRYFSVTELEKVKFSEPLSISEAAQKLNISETTLRRLEEKGLIKPERNGAGDRVYTLDCLEDFIRSDYYLRQGVIEDKILNEVGDSPEMKSDYKEDISNLRDQHKVLNAQIEDHKKHLGKLNTFRKMFYFAGVALVTTLVMLVFAFTVLFILYPSKTAKWFGYSAISAQAADSAATSGGSTYSPSSNQDNFLSNLLQPVGALSLEVVRVVSPDTYSSILANQPINDVNDIFSVNSDGNIQSNYNLTFPNSSYLIIPDTNMIKNLNAEYVQGKVPGINSGDLVSWDPNNSIAGLQIDTVNIKDSSITSGKIADGAVSQIKIQTITEAGKVAGSAVQLATGGGLADRSGLTLKTDCNVGEILNWTGSAWECVAQSKSDVTKILATNPLSYDTASGTLSLDVTKSDTWDLAYLHISDTNNPHHVTSAQILPAQSGQNGKVLGTNGSAVAWISNSSNVSWGAITGTLTDQSDLVAVLGAKQNALSEGTDYLNKTHLDLTYLGINATAADSAKLNGQSASYYQTALGFTPANSTTTVNTKALSSNITLTTSDIADSTNKRYVSDANLLVIGNTSGTNTGDETNSTIKTKLGITTLSGSNTGDQDLSGLVPKTYTVNGHALSSNVSVTATDLGLGNVDNTSDLNKPVSTATSTALGLKVDKTTTINSKALSSNITLDTSDVADTTNKRYVSDAQILVINAQSGTNTGDETATTIKNKLSISTLSGSNTGDQDLSGLVPKTYTVNGHALSSNVSVTATDLGLGNVDNTSDLNKPVSTATSTALGLKVDKTTTINSKALSGNIVLDTSDIAATTDKKYVTDAQLVILGNTSGTNTGDETTSTIKSKLGITVLSGSNTGDQTNISGNAGTVTNATLTTALTVNTGTVTIVGNAANTSVLTIGAGSVSVSGSNTGDQDLSGLVPKTYTVNSKALSGNITLSTADIADSTDKRYVTDAQLVILGNTSGTNTGDETATTIKNKLSISTLSGSNTGDQTLNSLLPTQTGNNGKVLSTNGTDASWISNSSGVAWGAITGTLSDQTDLGSALGGKQAASSALSSIAGLTYVSSSFVKMTGSGTFALDTNTYLTSLSGAVLTDQSTPQTIGTTGNRLTKLWTEDLTVTNVMNGSISGNAATVTTNANLTGEVTSTGNATTVTNSAVIGKVLTGFTSGAGVVTASDTILQAIQKLNGNVAASGSGTVTSVSVVTANGVSGSVATESTTPAITLTLGTITPTSVNGLTLAGQTTGFTIAGGTASKTLTVADNASVSGTNTGDQTNITGNAGTVTGLSVTSGKTLTAQNSLTLSGTDGSTLAVGTGGTLGTAAYTASTAYQSASSALSSIAGLTYVSPSFVKMTGAGTFALDTNTYLTSLSGAVLTDQSTPQTIGDTTNRLSKLWTTDLTATNTITGSVSGNAGTVTNATLTTALTVNTGTVTIVGNAANTSVLTIGAGSVSVSGSNTGDQDLSGLVPKTYTINSQALSGNITLSTADIADSTDRRYVTDAQRTVLGNTSGTNTGDQTNITGNAGTVTGLSVTSGKTLTAQNSLTLSGTDGSTLAIGTGGTLGTAAYTASSAYQAASSALTSVSNLTYVSPSFVKMTGANTFALDTNTYLTSLSGAVLTDQTSGQTIGDTTHRLTKLWTTDLTATNTITGSISGNAGSVTNATLTTALTVNTGTVTIIGNIANTSVLTIGAGAVSVSGSNTGDQDLSGLVPKTYTVNSKALSGNITLSTADIADSTDKRYITDAQRTVLGNTSGTNTGDNAANSSTHYIGTTAIALNRASASQALTGITSIDGSAATLTTPRAIYGNNFDGSAALTQIIASTYGGTGNGFTKFSGPTTAEKTFTLPDANATLLYSGGALGTPSSGSAANLTGTASGLTAGNVTTNANLTGVITSVGNATSIASQTGTGTKFVVDTSPVLVTPTIGVATATSIAIGANTLDTNEWAYLDGQNQAVKTTSTPAFAGLGIGAYNGANLLTFSQAIAGTVGTTTAIRINSAISTTTANGTGIMINPTYTTSSTGVGTGLDVAGSYQIADTKYATSILVASTVVPDTAASTYWGSYYTSPVVSSGTLGNNTAIAIANQSTGTVNHAIQILGNGVGNDIVWGTDSPSANLYHSATSTLKTDGSLLVAGSLGATGTRVVKGWFTDLQVTNAITGSVTGSAATLTTPRAIYGNNFDGSAALTQIIASTYGGTGNGFTKFSGPTTAEKTFTLPDASATLLYSGGALGTPSSGSAANLTSFPTLNQNTSGTAAGLSVTLVPASGGTGVANGTNNTITFTGNYSLGLTLSGSTALTLPTSGTLLTTTGSLSSLTGTVSSTVLGNSTVYIGTTAVALNRASASQALTGITSIDGNAATVTTNANLTGVITSVGNATSIASQTGTGTKFVVDTSPVLVTPTLGAATYTTLSGGNITDSGLTATYVTYAGASGILSNSANFTYDSTAGLALAATNGMAIGGTPAGRLGFWNTGTKADTSTSIYGFSDTKTISGTNTAAYGLYSAYNLTGTNTVTDVYGMYHILTVNSGTTATSSYGLRVANPTGSGAVTNNYGVYIDSMAKGGTINHGLYFAGTGTGNDINWSGDTALYRSGTATLHTTAGTVIFQTGSAVQIGETSDATFLSMSSNGLSFNRTAASYINQSVASGTIVFRTTSSTANDTTAMTISGNTVSVASLTSGRVTYAGTGGLLQDSSTFTYSGTGLSLTGASSAQLHVGAASGLSLSGQQVTAPIYNDTNSYIYTTSSSGSVWPYLSTDGNVVIQARTSTTKDVFVQTRNSSTKNNIFDFGSSTGALAGWVIQNGPQPTGSANLTGGYMADGTYYYEITAGNNHGVTLPGTESAAVTISGGGGNGSVSLTWTPIRGADKYNIYRTTTSGSYGTTTNTVATNVNGDRYTDTMPTANLANGTPATTPSAKTLAIGSENATTYLSEIMAAQTSAYNEGKIALSGPALNAYVSTTGSYAQKAMYGGLNTKVLLGQSNTSGGVGIRMDTFRAALSTNLVSMPDSGTMASLVNFQSSYGQYDGDYNSSPITTSLAGITLNGSMRRGTVSTWTDLTINKIGMMTTPNNWAANTSYAAGTVVKPVTGGAGYYYVANWLEPGQVAGTSDPSTEPTWPTSAAGATVTDGSGSTRITWVAITIPSITTGYAVYIDDRASATSFQPTNNYGVFFNGTGISNGLSWGSTTHFYSSAAASLGVQYSAASATGPTSFLRKSRGTSFSLAAISASDTIGTLSFQGYDGASWLGAASIAAVSDATPGTNDMPGRLVFSTTPDGSTTLTEAMRIDNAQKIWIGGGAGLDTNLYRSAANTLKTDDSFIAASGINSTRIQPRVGTATSSATPTINTDNYDVYTLTAQAVDITSMTTNLSGTPTDGQTLHIAITGTGARAITWGTSFEASTIALPTTTVSTNRLDVEFVWNSVTSKWRITQTY